MPTQLSIEGRLLDGLGARNMPVAAFADVAKLDGIRFASTTKLNESFRDSGSIPLNSDTAARCWALWQEIEEMCQSFHPFQLSLKDGEQVHGWLVARRKGEIFHIVVDGLVSESKPVTEEKKDGQDSERAE
jgi:hypothetical protein